ncbi:MAG: DNA mismatch repair protein MutS [Bacteroidota bacterium]|nr:DNA mismatch repair protein MutS [Bacteroidota bacterium]
MTFHSILYKSADVIIKEKAPVAPDFFVDLNLDQIINAITSGKDEYNLKPFYYTSLKDFDSIMYRHEIIQDLENSVVFEDIKSFAAGMKAMRDDLVQKEKLYYKYQFEQLFLDSVKIYCEAVKTLGKELSEVNLKSQGLLAFREYLKNYIQSRNFTKLCAETNKIISDLSTIRYCLIINDLQVEVRKYDSENDFSAEIEEAFAKFKQGAVSDYMVEYSHHLTMNHVETKILDRVVLLYPDIFLDLDTFYEENQNYTDKKIVIFDREIQFYIAYLEYLVIFKQKGLKFCYPEFSKPEIGVYDFEVFDLALSYKLIKEKSSVVLNDFYLENKERILVVSGPNQGGKTTFARTFGQLFYLANLGFPVPGRKAKLILFDKLFTHFEKEENIQNLHSKLEDELVRIHDIFDGATPNSIIIMNEILTSTTLQDAVFLSKKIMEKIIQLDLLCVWVTFIDELASFSEKTVSVVSSVVPENTALRTYKMVRGPANGLAYTLSMVEKYQLTYEVLKQRIKS